MFKDRKTEVSFSMLIPHKIPLDIVLKYLRENGIIVHMGMGNIRVAFEGDYINFGTCSMRANLKPQEAFELADKLKAKFEAKIKYIWFQYDTNIPTKI